MSTLSCSDIKDELGKLASIRREAEGKKGLSAQNVAFALFFWPGAVVNEADNRNVIDKVDSRTRELVTVQAAKSCPVN